MPPHRRGITQQAPRARPARMGPSRESVEAASISRRECPWVRTRRFSARAEGTGYRLPQACVERPGGSLEAVGRRGGARGCLRMRRGPPPPASEHPVVDVRKKTRISELPSAVRGLVDAVAGGKLGSLPSLATPGVGRRGYSAASAPTDPVGPRVRGPQHEREDGRQNSAEQRVLDVLGTPKMSPDDSLGIRGVGAGAENPYMSTTAAPQRASPSKRWRNAP